MRCSIRMKFKLGHIWLLVWMLMPLWSAAQQQEQSARPSHTSTSWVRTFEDRIQAFKTNADAMVKYSEGGYEFLVVVYRDGRVEFTGLPRFLKNAPLGTYPYEIPLADIARLENAFLQRRYLQLAYGPSRGLTSGRGAALEFKDRDGRSQIFSLTGPKTPPEDAYELIRLLFEISKIETYACTQVLGQYSACRQEAQKQQ